MTTHYELLYIITSKLTEEETEPINKQVLDLIEKNEGKITLQENYGKKKLAYPIKHHHNGYYRLFEFDLEPDKLGELEKKFMLTNEILRHQIFKKKLKTEEEIKKERELISKIEEKKEKAKEKEMEQEQAAAPTATTPADEKAPAKEKMKLEDLDKKLDEILGGDDII